MPLRLCLCVILLAWSVVSIRALDFPKPEPEKVFSELKIYDAQGHPFRAALEDWTGAKHRVAEDPAWAAWLKSERVSVDAWMKRHHDRVDWLPGWSHDGVSPKDGSRVIWTEDVPGEKVSFFKSPSDPHIEITPKLMAWWVVTFRGRHFDMIEKAARLYRLTGDEHYATWAASQIDFYADHLQEWKPQRAGHEARLFWQTLTEASNLVKYTNAVRLLGDTLTPDHKQALRTKFFQAEVNALNANFQEIHNIAAWQRCSVAQVALLYNDEAMWKEAIDGKFGLRRQMAEGVTSDYLWWEQSLGYNNFVVEATLTLFTAAGLYGRAEQLGDEMCIAENLMLSPSYLRFPTGLLPNPADNAGLPTAPNREVFASAYRVFPTPIGLTQVSGRRDWDTLLDPPPASPRPAELPQVTSRNLESTRMAILKEGPWQVFIHYGQMAKSHIQAEALNYSVFYNNTDVTHDTGTVGYGSPLHKNYYTQGLNHNVPLINGEGEVPPQYGQLQAYSTHPAHVAAAEPGYRPDAKARRELAIDGTKLIDTATIESSTGPQKLGIALHLQGKVRLPSEFQAAPDFAKDRPKSFSYWRDVTAATYHDHASFTVNFDGAALRVTVAVPGEFKIWHASTPDSPPKRRESFYLETIGTAATFTTTYEPGTEM